MWRGFNTSVISVRLWTEVGWKDINGKHLKPQRRQDNKTYPMGIFRKKLNHKDIPYILAKKEIRKKDGPRQEPSHLCCSSKL